MRSPRRAPGFALRSGCAATVCTRVDPTRVTPRIAHTREALGCTAESPPLPVSGQNINRGRTNLPREG